MKRLLLINPVCGLGSTGKIVAGIASEYEENGWEVKIAHGRKLNVPQNCRRWSERIGGMFSVYIHALAVRFWGDYGLGYLKSYFSTKAFLRRMDKWKPTVVWLHNIHGYYVNVELLFEWLKQHPEIEVKWTLHDCWSFTGRCGHFMISGCEQWKSHCVKCPRTFKGRNQLLSRNCYNDYERKRQAFAGVRQMSLIAPCAWLANLTRQSFLREYPVSVVRNKIDTSIFKHVDSKLRSKNNWVGKIVILGVAAVWNSNKGIDDYLQLRTQLDSSKYVIVMVGLTRKQIRHMPKGIYCVEKTANVDQLVEYYSTADWFFNPTHEDNYPTVNLEAKACGCRIATYDTGGAPETIEGYKRGWVLYGDDRTPDGFVRLLKNCNEKTVFKGME